MLLCGVDFSGAKTVPNDTWLVTADLHSLGLEVQTVKNTGSHALAKELDLLKEPRVVGMDFPFSVPAGFLAFLARKLDRAEFQDWQEVAETLVFMNFETFKQLVDEYEIQPLRYTDSKSLRVAKSPLHTGNPSMIQMTFHGMRLLATLNPDKYAVFPFQSDKGAKFCTLLEVYPREILYTLGLPDQGYKAKEKKTQEKAHGVRRTIVEGLFNLRERGDKRFEKCPRLHMDNSIKGAIIASDHAVDALMACYAAALFFAEPDLFNDPWQSNNENVLLEGWIYGPQKLVAT